MPLPPIKIPPKSGSKAPPSSNAAIAALLKKAPAWRPYVGAVTLAAKNWGVDPAQLLATLVWENSSANPNATSSAGALGLAQILDGKVDPSLNQADYNAFVAKFGDTISKQKAADPAFSINYMAWRMAGGIQAYGGDLNAWYSGQGGYGKPRGYNPGFSGDSRGAGPAALFKASGVATYQPQIPTGPQRPETPQQKAGVETWAVLKDGKLKWVTTQSLYDQTTNTIVPQPPKNTLTVFKQPVTQSAFLQQMSSINDDYLAYTGKRVSFAQAAKDIKNGTSTFQRRQQLAETPAFFNSPVWKQNAPSYEAVWHQVYGQASTPDRAAIKYAVANNLASGFQDYLRKRPDYQTSQEFQSKTASFTNVYSTIYGSPDPQGHERIKTAAAAGWDENQFAQFLRQQPEWKGSAEAQQLYYGLANRLGLIQGAQTVLQNPPTPTSPPPPTPTA